MDAEVTEVTRRSIIDALLVGDVPFHGKLDLLAFLRRVWNLSAMPSTDYRFDSADGDIWQHMVRNDDWDDSFLLYEYLELAHSEDGTFLEFVEASVHPLVLDGEAVDERVKEINRFLVADGFKLVQTSTISGRPVYTAKPLGGAGTESAPLYEVVLSFAGEDREYVEAVADCLIANDVAIFYDRYEEVTLWGKDLAEHLDMVYRSGARYCVMFISKAYGDKIWTNHERRSALARALEEKTEYILPVRFDDTEIPGIRPTLGYVDVSSKSPTALGELIMAKLGRHVPPAT